MNENKKTLFYYFNNYILLFNFIINKLFKIFRK